MLNRCDFIGNLGAAPEMRYTTSGTAVANFTVASTEKYKNKAGVQVEETEWVKIVAFNRLAEICGEYLTKGSKVYVSGKMKTKKWQDQDGKDRYTTEIVAKEMKMLSARGQQDSGGQGGYDPSGGTGENVPF